MPKTPQPSDFELKILSHLWRDGPSTARQVLEGLRDGKRRAYTSVLSVMQVMEKKGLLAVGQKRGLANVYRARVGRKRALGPVIKGLVERVFAGDASAAVQQLLSESRVSPEEIAEIRRVLDEMEKRD